tara:strand:- start:38 stop:424 length:387 start_codon:yes stop_codon:yes gene_type:complete
LSRQKTRTKLFSAGSEMRKGFTMPTIKKIRSVLMSRSKTFLVNLIITMMAKKSKTEKIKILIKIEKGKIVRKVKRRKKAKSTKKGMVRKTARKAYKKPKNGRKKGKLKKGSAAAKRKMAKVRAAKRRR